ncbi:rotatin [Nilaparvata lugens]|uniref:rotatin n=1 Tax=Nilaparvata lugens TaxID=108931 RepID=UPI00193D809B|nr:rotatin [Nilaparvata lugens]
MTDLSVHIFKLGHELEEIRTRSLRNLLGKLECGLLTTSVLVDQDKLFEKLVDWFYFDNAPEKLSVLKLIYELLKVNGAVKLLLRADPNLKRLDAIKFDDNDTRSLLKKINDIVKQHLEHRHTEPERLPDASPEPPPIVINYRESPSTLARGTPSVPISTQCPTARTNDSSSSGLTLERSSFRIWILPWQQLIKSDVNVLSAVESSLSNYDTIEHSCNFFANVMLQDFPVEVFLQRQGIIKCLLNLLDKESLHAVSALNEFLKRLENRLLFFFDPATSCLKIELPGNAGMISSDNSSPITSAQRDSPVASDILHQYQREGYKVNRMMSGAMGPGNVDQLSVPQLCATLLKTVAPLCGKLQGVTAPLIPRTLKLLSYCIPEMDSFWASSDPYSLVIQSTLRAAMLKFANAILESVMFEPMERILMISGACLFVKTLVPLSMAGAVVPQELQKVLSDLLLDPPTYILYKELHLLIASYVQCFQTNADPRYEVAENIHKSMKCALPFMKNGSSLPQNEFVKLFKESMSCLLIHRRMEVIDTFVELCSERLQGRDTEEASSLIVELLAHVDLAVSSRAYLACHKIVSTLLGPKHATTGVDPFQKLRFILNSNVLREIVCHGIINQDNKIQQQAEEIIILIMKCKMLVSDSSWMKMWSEISTVIPLLQGFSGGERMIGAHVMDLFNPDIAKSLGISELQILLANLRLLFSPYKECRKEASARLMWMVGTALVDKTIRDICLVDRSVSGKQKLGGIYEPGSIVRVLDLLNRSNIVEHETVHDAALTQLSVMTDDPYLHEIFLENGGLDTVLRLMNSLDGSKEEKKILLPAIAILKNITRHCSKIRLQLCQNSKLLKTIIKGLFKFRKDWRLQRDATQLLAFLAFAEFYITTKGSISLPHIVLVNFRLPFECVAHWKVSPNTNHSSTDSAFLNDASLQALLSVLWLELEVDDVMAVNKPPEQCNPELTVTKQALRQVQGSCVTHNCKLLLHSIQDAITHNEVLIVLPKLKKLLEVCFIHSEEKEKVEHNPAWRKSFYKFVTGFPNNEDDEKLLYCILDFLNFLAGTLEPQRRWITSWKELCMGMFDVARVCIGSNVSETEAERWSHLTGQLLRCLHHTHTQHFYNLAFLAKALDTLSKLLSLKHAVPCEHLKCGVLWELLAAFHCGTPDSCMGLGITRRTIMLLVNILHLDMKNKVEFYEKLWIQNSNQIPAFLAKALDTLSKLLSLKHAVPCEHLKCGVLWELLAAFHCGTPDSCMGLGITRRTIMLLVNILHLDMKNKKNGKWEEDWVKEEYFFSLVPLFQSKDVVIRASAFQLFIGLCQERHVFLIVMETLPDLWLIALRAFLDHNESSLVREQAILLCACLASYDKKEYYVTSIGEHDFYHNLKIIINNLIMEQVFWNKYTFLMSDDIELENVPTTPGLIKAACQLILNLLVQFSVNVGNDLRDSGVAQMLMSISDDIELENVPTTPGLIKAACQLILNLLVQFSVNVGNDLRGSGVAQMLMRCLTRRSNSESTVREEVGDMFSSICSVLCLCLNKSISIPTDLLPSLCRLFNDDLYDIQHDKIKENLWGKLLRVMSLILHLSESTFSFPSNVVSTLCSGINKTTNITLQMHSLLSLPGLTFNFNQDDCKQICHALISVWEKLIPTKRKEALVYALTTLVGHSREASLIALQEDLLAKLIYRFRSILVTLTVETGDTSRLKKGNATLADLCLYLGLSCNLMSGSPEVKVAASDVGFADTLHKLWVWCLADSSTHVMSLKTLITFTADNPTGARSLVLTSTVSGVGQRKTPSAFSLVHALISMIVKDHCSSEVLSKAFLLLTHACQASEARAIVAKSNLLTKFINLGLQKRSPSEDVDGVWLKFLNVFTFYADGQVAVSKIRDVLERLIEYSSHTKPTIRITALYILRNIAFHSSNRPRLLTTDEFLSLLCDKLVANSAAEEKRAVALIVWALAANNQKAKLCLRGAGLDSRLQLAAATIQSNSPVVQLLDNTLSILNQSR